MQKIYVLLRNDKQTGPYSLEEIIQFDLKPYDLIWIEGKSAGWYYPQEIGALHPYLQFLPQKPKTVVQNTSGTVFVAMPSTPRVEAAQPAPLPEAPVIVAETISRPLEAPSKNFEEAIYAQFAAPTEKETAYTATAVQPKQKKKGTVTAAGGVMAVLVVGGVFAASWMLNRHNYDEAVTPEPAVTAPASAEIASTAVAKTDDTNNTSTSSKQMHRLQKRNGAASGPTVPVTKQVVSKKQKTVTVSPAEDAVDVPTSTIPPQEEPVLKKDESTGAPAGTAAPQEQKKKLRDKILDIFKKKPEEQKSDEAKPADNSNGGRTATHREAGANLAQMVSIRFDVPNDWMMGIKGAKAILVNRSSEKISKASVEVLYYNDDNELLQKKVIIFSKIDGKDSQTIAIPDHSTATRVDYNVLSVTGAGQPPA